MLPSLSTEHMRFFERKHHLALDELIDQYDCTQLLAHQESVRPFPKLLTIVRKKKLGELAFELLGRRPLRLPQMHFMPSFESRFQFYHDELGLLLSLKEGWGIYFRTPFPEKFTLYNLEDQCYLFLVFSPRYSESPLVLK